MTIVKIKKKSKLNIPILRIDKCLACSSSKRFSCKVDVRSIDLAGKKISSDEELSCIRGLSFTIYIYI